MSDKPAIKKRRKVSYLPSVISIAMVLFMLGLLGLIFISGEKLSNHLKENFQLTIFLKKDVPEDDMKAISQKIQKSAYARNARLVSREDAAREFTQEIGQDFVSFLGFNPLLPSIELFLKSKYATPEQISKIDTELRRNPEVQEVVYQKSIIEELNRNVKIAGSILTGLSIIFLIIAIVLINNTIRLNLYARRFIIKSMQMVGATHGFIIQPFVIRSFVHGLYGGMIACFLLMGILYGLPFWFNGIQSVYNLSMFAILFVVIIIAGIIISMLSGLVSTNHYLKMKIDDLY